MRNTTLKVLTCAIFILALTSLAQAQATRTWVSGLGNDENPCSRTAPCKTWAGAISKTAAGGEIDALDPGGYGTLSITKSITIDGGTGSGWGSTLASLATTGFIVNDSASGSPGTIVVKLRNLSINGAGSTLGTNGISFTSGAALSVENVRIYHFTGDGIRKASSTAGRLIVQDTVISDCAGDGIELAGTNAANDAVTIENVKITRNGNGVKVSNRASVAISNSVISNNTATVSSAAVISTSAVVGGAIIDLENCQINLNSVGVQPNANNVIRLSNVHMTGNGNALNFNGGTIGTYNNNRIFGNAAGENFASLTDILLQ
jgi:hypothetical protein